MGIIETFIKDVYYPNSKNLEKLDIEWCDHFLRQADPNLCVFLHLEMSMRNKQPCREGKCTLRHN